MKDKKLWTKQEVANYLNLTVRGVEGLMSRRALPYYRLGHRTVRFDPDEIESYLEQIKVRSVNAK